MPRYKEDINNIYISERMQECLRHIQESTLTTVTAPMGYGKTTAVFWYLEQCRQQGGLVFRVNIYSNNVHLFWQSFRSAFRGTSLGERLQEMPFPADQTAVGMFAESVSEFLRDEDRQVYLFLDDWHLMSDNRVLGLLLPLCNLPTDRLHIILASRSAMMPMNEKLHLGKRLYHIPADKLQMNFTEMAAYCRRCGVDLPEDTFQTLFQRSEGWVSYIYLNLLHFVESGSLLREEDDIYEMIGESLFAHHDEAERRFMRSMWLADEFTAEQADYIMDSQGTQELLRQLMKSNSFIRYLPDTKSYRFHHMLREYAGRQFAGLPAQEQRDCRVRYGQWHEMQGQYHQAILFFGQAEDRRSALRVIGLDRGIQITAIAPEWTLSLLERCTEEELVSEPRGLLVLMRRMFTSRQISKMLELKELLMKAADRPELPEEERGNILGECDLIMSFLRYNDISAMSELHRNASRLMTRPAISIQKTGSWTFGSPSVLMMFHRESGKLDSEIREMNQCMPHYYQVTDGHGLGAEQIMEAEAHFNRGNLVDARIMLEKARATVAGTGQHYILLCCELLSLRLALYGELPVREDWYGERLRLFKTLHDPMLFTVLDGCSAYIHALLGEMEQIPAWIREGKLAEANLLAPGRPMFEIIYNQVLLQQKQYAMVLGRGDALLGACRGIHYLLCEIHLHIQLSAANFALGKREEAMAELQTALEQALLDGILMPFVENGRLLKPLLEQLPAKYAGAAGQILDLYRRMEAARPRGAGPLEGLTERECDIARLTAAGKSRKEIGQELFLSEHTVKNNLTRIFDKLGITGTPKQKQLALSELISGVSPADKK